MSRNRDRAAEYLMRAMDAMVDYFNEPLTCQRCEIEFLRGDFTDGITEFPVCNNCVMKMPRNELDDMIRVIREQKRRR